MYNYRHAFISYFLDVTGDFYAMAQMCDISVMMLSHRYGHSDVDKLHEKFLAFHRIVSHGLPAAVT